MKIHCFIQKVIDRITLIHRVKYFKELTGNQSEGLKILGKVHLINNNIQIGNNVVIYPEVQFFGDGEITIGDNVSIGNGTILYSSKKGGGISIGNNTLISAQCYIIDSDHGIEKNMLIREQSTIVAPVSIGNDVWISAGCKILRGSKIDDGCIVGAMTLIKGTFPSNSVIVGIPGKVIKYRPVKVEE